MLWQSVRYINETMNDDFIGKTMLIIIYNKILNNAIDF